MDFIWLYGLASRVHERDYARIFVGTGTLDLVPLWFGQGGGNAASDEKDGRIVKGGKSTVCRNAASNFSTEVAISALISVLMAQKCLVLLVAIFVIGGGATLARAQNSPVLDEGVGAHEGLYEIYRRFSEGYKKLDGAAVANLYRDGGLSGAGK